MEIYDDDVGEMVVIGDDGNLYQRLGDERWVRLPSPTNSALMGLSVGGDLDVAAGKGGTVIERAQRARSAGSSPDDDQYDGRGENDQPSDQVRDSGSTEAGTAGDSADESSTEGPTREELLLLLGQGIDASEFAAATEYDAAAIEQTLLEIATNSGADAEAFREALLIGA